MNPLAVPPARDEAGASQVRQVARNLRLRLVENRHEVTDAQLAERQEIQYAQPGRVAERLEKRIEVQC